MPSPAGKIRFFTLEDEHGHVNVTIKPDLYQRYRREAARPILVVDGVVESHDRVWSLLATAITPLPQRTRSRLTHTITGRGLSCPPADEDVRVDRAPPNATAQTGVASWSAHDRMTCLCMVREVTLDGGLG